MYNLLYLFMVICSLIHWSEYKLVSAKQEEFCRLVCYKPLLSFLKIIWKVKRVKSEVESSYYYQEVCEANNKMWWLSNSWKIFFVVLKEFLGFWCGGLVVMFLWVFCFVLFFGGWLLWGFFFSLTFKGRRIENLILFWRLANKAWRHHGGSGQGTVCSEGHTVVPQPDWLFLDAHKEGRPWS